MQERPLSEIAAAIRKDWADVNYAAAPYLDAMDTLDSINDNYFQDTAKSVVAYFLCNAEGWGGAAAKEIKLELNGLIK